MGSLAPNWDPKAPVLLAFLGKFPTQRNRELFRANREFVGVNREFIEPITDTLTTPSQMRFSVGTGIERDDEGSTMSAPPLGPDQAATSETDRTTRSSGK